MTRLSASLLMALPLLAHAAELTPEAFGYGTVIVTEGGAALYALRLPAAVYQRSTRTDLGDLRVYNGAAEAVPHALRTPLAEPAAEAPGTSLPLFPLPKPTSTGEAPLDVRIERDGTLVRIRDAAATVDATPAAWLADASGVRQPLATLELAFAGTAPLATRIDVAASDDLREFRPVAARVPVVRTRMGGRELSQLRIDLGRLKAKYLRIAGSDGTLPAPLEHVAVRAPNDATDAQREHLIAAGGRVEGRGEYVFELDGAYPADRVGVELQDDNSVLPYEIDARAAADRDWRRLGAGTAYRLVQDGVTATSPAIAVTSGPYRRYRIRAVGNAPLGQPPRLRVEWRPAEVVFAARGHGPFMLAYGSGTAPPAALPIASLIPGHGTDRTVEPARAIAGQNVQLAGPAALEPQADVRQWGLWGVMGAGALVLGLMAARLLRQQSRRS